MSIRQGNKVIAGHINYHPDLFDHKWADHLLNDVSWLRADTFSWQDGGVYEAAYDHLESDISGKSLSSETISGITVQFYLADDGHKICPDSQESNVVSIYNATGVAWYYIIDTVNTRFKLPRTQFGITGLRDTVGKFVQDGLPNITGDTPYVGACYNNNNSSLVSGAFASYDSGSGAYAGGGGYSNAAARLNFNASRSSSIYGNSDTVQPKATEMYLYFYVGNFTQTALENTAGLNASLFNNKVDLDGSNATFAHIVEKQDPTAGNNYTWYRKYSDGWVEQGGRTGAVNGVDATTIVNLPIAMSDANYAAYVTISRDAIGAYRDQFLVAYNRNATFFWVYSNWAGSGNASQNNYAQWLVCGIAA